MGTHLTERVVKAAEIGSRKYVVGRVLSWLWPVRL
jgi:hypothetical protein